MSRFGRNYLEVGQLIEIVFPLHNVRLIAIADGVDSDKGEDDFTAFRNVINELYLKDLSRKLRSSQRIKSKQGYAIGLPPIGYKSDSDEPKRWIIDEEGAEIVRHIFNLRIQGYSVNDIATMMKRAKVLTPTAYAKNARHGTGRSNASCFSGKIRCAACGEYFGPKTWHSSDPYKKRVWQCNGKYRERSLDHCQTPHLSEEQLQGAFVAAFNEVVADRERYIATMEPAIALLTGCADLDEEAEILAERATGVYAQMEELVADNARRYQDQAEYRERYAELNRRYMVIKARQTEVEAERRGRVAKQENMRQFLETVHQWEALLKGFDETLWRSTVNEIIVHAADDIRVMFRDGREVRMAV